MHICTYVGVCTYAHTFVGQKSALDVIALQCCPSCILGQCLSLAWNAYQLDWDAWPRSTRDPPISNILGLGLHMYTTGFYIDFGDRTKVLMLA